MKRTWNYLVNNCGLSGKFGQEMKRNLRETKIKPQWHLWGVFLPHRVTRPSPYWRSPPHKPSHVSCFPEFTVKQITWLTNIIFIPRASPILFNFSWHCSQSHLSKGKTHALRLEILFYIIAVHANNKIEYIICVNFAWSSYIKCDHWKCWEGFFFFYLFFFPSCTRPLAQCWAKR